MFGYVCVDVYLDFLSTLVHDLILMNELDVKKQKQKTPFKLKPEIWNP